MSSDFISEEELKWTDVKYPNGKVFHEKGKHTLLHAWYHLCQIYLIMTNN